MPRYQRYVDIAALANRLAVVDRLQDREPPRVLLYLARERVQETGPCVRCQRLPTRQRGARRLDGRVHIGAAPLGDIGDLFTGRRVAGFEVPAFRGRGPGAADEVPEAAFELTQPRECLGRVFGRS